MGKKLWFTDGCGLLENSKNKTFVFINKAGLGSAFIHIRFN